MIKNLSMILACEKNGGIGLNNSLAWHYPEDLAWFKEHTSGKAIIMGGNTLRSIIARNSKLLPKRRHIVLTRGVAQTPTDKAIDYHFQMSTIVDCVNSNAEQEFFVIGGAQIYEMFKPLANKIFLTRVNKDYECDTHINIEQLIGQRQLISSKQSGDLIFEIYQG